MSWERFKPKEPIDWTLLGLHLVIIVYAIITEIFHLNTNVFLLALFIVIINLVWTVSMILLVKKLTDRIDKELSEKQSELDTEKKNFEENKRIYLSTLEKLGKKANYAEILFTLNSAFGEVHQVMREINLNGGSDQYFNINLHELDKPTLQNYIQNIGNIIANINNALTRLCNHTETAFRILTGDETVAVCIKIISGDLNGDLESCDAITLVRGNATQSKRGLKEQYKADGKVLLHKLTELNNTSFSTVIRSIERKAPRPFFCNSLPLSWPYENSSFYNVKYNDGVKPQKRPGMNWKDDEIIADWTLPYKAAIVSPLYPGQLDDIALNKLKGFFCIDTAKTNTFDETYDSILLAGIADGCYNKIALLKRFLDKFTEAKIILNSSI